MQYLVIFQATEEDILKLSDKLVNRKVNVIQFSRDANVMKILIEAEENYISEIVKIFTEIGLKDVKVISLAEWFEYNPIFEFLPFLMEFEEKILSKDSISKTNSKVKKFLQLYASLRKEIGVKYPFTLLFLLRSVSDLNKCLKLICFYYGLNLNDAKKLLENMISKNIIAIAGKRIILSVKALDLLKKFREVLSSIVT